MYLKSYKELIVWQKSMTLVREIFVLTDKFPKSEIYGLTSQMRRAAVSIPSNIAEGYGRNSQREYKYSCSIAYGSALELETQLLIAKELQFIQNIVEIEALLTEVIRMLYSMKSSFNKLNAKP